MGWSTCQGRRSSVPRRRGSWFRSPASPTSATPAPALPAAGARRRAAPRGAVALVLAALCAPVIAAAQGGIVTVTGVRSWPAPANTRVVFDFSAEVMLVAPDSGRTKELAVSIPGVV